MIASFKRVEKKFVVNSSQKDELLKVLLEYMDYDKYCLNNTTYKIQNIYYDTLNDDLIRNSIQKPNYKEKIRVRKYEGVDRYYLEIKKKANGVVGKRRVGLTKEELDDFIERGVIPQKEGYTNNQVLKEINYFLSLHKVEKKVYISYERLALFSRNDPSLRVTFDDKIHVKRANLVFDEDDYEDSLLPEGQYILEIKSTKNYPLWLVKELSRLNIRPKSFSKYGTEYKKHFQNMKEEPLNV